MKKDMAKNLRIELESVLEYVCSNFGDDFIHKYSALNTHSLYYAATTKRMRATIEVVGPHMFRFIVSINQTILFTGFYSARDHLAEVDRRVSVLPRQFQTYGHGEEYDSLNNNTNTILLRYGKQICSMYASKQAVVPEHMKPEDLKFVLDKAFDIYIQEEHHKQGGYQSLFVHERGIRLVMRYAERDGKHTELNIEISLEGEKARKILYVSTFDFLTGTFKTIEGSKPEGFDEGFAKFKLVSQLTV